MYHDITFYVNIPVQSNLCVLIFNLIDFNFVPINGEVLYYEWFIHNFYSTVKNPQNVFSLLNQPFLKLH